MRISTKLIVNTVIISIFSVLVSTIAIGWMIYANANSFLEKLAIERFISLRDSKVDQIQDYYNTIAKQVVTFAHDYTIVKGMQEFITAFNDYDVKAGKAKYKTDVIKQYIEQFANEYANLNAGATIDTTKLLNMLNDKAFTLQYNYIIQNPYPMYNKSKYDYDPGDSKYNQIHKQFHPVIKEYQDKFKYDDILLADAKTGNIVYSVQKNLDYTTSLITGPYAQSSIGEVFKQANAATSKDFFAITDFTSYLPICNKVAAFVAAPIFDEMDNKIGVLIFHISPDFMNKVMTSNGRWKQSGWGNTGETYILGHDSIMRTTSRFFVEDPAGYLQQMAKLGVDAKTLRMIQAKQTTIGLQEIHSVGAKAVVQGKTGVAYYKDYRKQPVIAVYGPINIPGLKWGVICGIDTIEAFAAVHELANKVILYSVIIIFIISVIAISIGLKLSRQISGPIEKFSNIIYLLAKKQDLTKRIKVETDDELGQMAKALNTLISNLQQACKMTLESTKQVQSVATKLFTLNKDAKQSNLKNGAENIASNIQDKVNATDEDETNDSLQLLTAKLENLSNQFKIFEEESERTSDW